MEVGVGEDEDELEDVDDDDDELEVDEVKDLLESTEEGWDPALELRQKSAKQGQQGTENRHTLLKMRDARTDLIRRD